jgi:hypothetical protein
MANVFSKLVGNADSAVVIPGFLRPIDTKVVTKELHLIETARERGKDELPRSDETVWDGVEQTIVQKIQAEWAWQGDALIKTLRAYADRLIGFSVSGKLAELQSRTAKSRYWIVEAKHPGPCCDRGWSNNLSLER